MLEKKKALTSENLILLIIAILTFLIIFFWVTGNISSSNYSSSLLPCQKFINSINGKPLYFGEGYDAPTPKLISGISNFCPSKDVEVSSKNIDNALNLVDDCWYKAGKGKDIMPNLAVDMRICIYCGRIKSKENVDDFKTEFTKKLKEDEKYRDILSNDTESINMNSVSLLSGIPKTISEDNEVYVYYMIQKPAYAYIDEKSTLLAFYQENYAKSMVAFVGKELDIGPLLNYYGFEDLVSFGQITKTSASVVLVDMKKTKEEDFLNIKNQIEQNDCYVIYPKDNYD